MGLENAMVNPNPSHSIMVLGTCWSKALTIKKIYIKTFQVDLYEIPKCH